MAMRSCGYFLVKRWKRSGVMLGGASGANVRPFGNSGFSRRIAVPEGLHENSPAFQRRERWPEVSSPEGTSESRSFVSLCQPSLRDSFGGWPRPGVETPGYSHFVPPGQLSANFRKALG